MSARPPRASRWGAMLLACGAGVAGAAQIGKLPASLLAIRAELDMGLVAAGWALSLFNVIGATAGVAIGSLADRFGHRRLILIGLVGLAAASVGGALAENATIFMLSRFAEGLGGVIVFIAAPGLIVRLVAAREQRLAFGIWGGYMPAGVALMVLLTPAALDIVGWRGFWLVNAAMLLVMAAALAAGTRDLVHAPAPDGGGWRGLWRNVHRTVTARGPLLLALCFATYTANYLAVLGFLPTFLMEARGVAAVPAAIMTALAIGVNVLGNLTGGWMLHRGVARWRLLVAASTIMGLASLGIFSPSVPTMSGYLLAVLFSACGGILPAAVLGAAPVHAPTPSHVATTNGLIIQGAGFGQLFGPPALAALVAAYGGWQVGPALIIALAALGIALALVLRKIETPKAAPPRN